MLDDTAIPADGRAMTNFEGKSFDGVPVNRNAVEA
jgi:hypothetical protein